MTDTIACEYSCRQCGIDSAAVDVEIRGKEQDVVDWVKNTVGNAIGADHQSRSPTCLSTHMDNLKIPLPAGSTMVGRPAEH